MASGTMGSSEEGEEVSLLERILKVLVVVLCLFFAYSYITPILSELFVNSQNDRVTRDFTIIAEAISRYQLTGRKYQETSLGKLVDQKLLAEMPKDPWGNEYVYNWYFEELVSPGPNKVLNTFVPELHDEATEPDSDDRVKTVGPMTRLVYCAHSGGNAQIVKCELDGVGSQVLEEQPGEMLGLSILSGTKLIVYAAKKDNAFELKTLDFGTGEHAGLTSDPFQELEPVWGSAKNDLVIFESDKEQPNSLSVFSIQLPAKSWVKLADKPSDDPSPEVALGDRRTLYYAGRTAAGANAILSQTPPEGAPSEVVSGRGTLAHPSPSPNGSYLAYLVLGGQGASLEVMELKSRKVVCTKEGAAPKGYIAWSPDSDKLAYQVPDKDDARIALLEPLSGRSFVHPQFVMALARFAWIK